jgi:signal transduction histidine kinase
VSLRVRLALAIAVISVLVAGGISIAVYQRSYGERVERARESAARQLQTAASIVRLRLPGGTIITPSGAYLLTSDGEALGDAVVAAGVPEALRQRVAADPGRVLTEPALDGVTPAVYAGTTVPSVGTIFVRQSFEQDEQDLSALRAALIRITVAAAIVGAVLGAIVASALSRRLRRSATLARRLAAGDLEARLRPRGRDEIAALGRALDEMADSLGETIRELDQAAERERRFSADVAHELRTPITGLLAAASLLEESPDATMVQERAAALAELVEDLLEVMRLDAGGETARQEEFDLVRLVRDVVGERVPEAVVDAPEHLVVQSDPRRLERVLGNLVDNARRHGADPIEVRVDPVAMAVTVRDHGRGFGEFLDYAGDRFAMASADRAGGSGLGIAIAKGQARVLGGELILADDDGAVATLRLPTGIRIQPGTPYAESRG